MSQNKGGVLLVFAISAGVCVGVHTNSIWLCFATFFALCVLE